MITLRNPVDGSTVEADAGDTDRLERLAKFGYRAVGQPSPVGGAPKPAKKAAPRKRAAKKK